jgi:hypothetical protein
MPSRPISRLALAVLPLALLVGSLGCHQAMQERKVRLQARNAAVLDQFCQADGPAPTEAAPESSPDPSDLTAGVTP